MRQLTRIVPNEEVATVLRISTSDVEKLIADHDLRPSTGTGALTEGDVWEFIDRNTVKPS